MAHEAMGNLWCGTHTDTAVKVKNTPKNTKSVDTRGAEDRSRRYRAGTERSDRKRKQQMVNTNQGAKNTRQYA